MNQKADGLNSIVDAFNAITGWNLTMDEAREAGHRSMILQSLRYSPTWEDTWRGRNS